LEAGSSIKCVDKATVVIDKGTFEVKNLMNGTTPAETQPEATIETSGAALGTGGGAGVAFSEGTTLTMPDTEYNTLRVVGAFNTLGEVKLAISRISDKSDKIIATKKAFLDNDKAKLTLRWGDPTLDPLPGVGATWDLILSEDDTVSAPPKAANVTYPAVPATRKLEAKLAANEQKLFIELLAND
jgi:hypothetical protein